MTTGRLERDAARMVRQDRTDQTARLAFWALAWLFLACVLVQVFMVGLTIFAQVDRTLHRDFAYLYGWLTPVLVMLGAAARLPAATRGMTLALLVLFAIETVLPSQRDSIPVLAALHTPIALAIFALAITIVRRTAPERGWRRVLELAGVGRRGP